MSVASTAQFAPSAGLAGLPRLPAVAAPGAPQLQGVDLRLDQFDLSEAKRVSLEAQAGSWGSQAKPLDKCVSVGRSFFGCLDDSLNLFNPEDQALLQKVFNPTLSDRRTECDLFVPPNASFSYVNMLRALVKKEDEVREHRKQAFFSQDFAVGNPGALFPHSWTPSVEITHGHEPIPEGLPQSTLIRRPEYEAHQRFLLEHLDDLVPIFDRTTEEGLRFRIYSLGSLEVRSTQSLGCKEVIGAVFSMRRQTVSAASLQVKAAGEQEMVLKAAEYVERIVGTLASPKDLNCHYYLVLETEKGNTIVMERLGDGQLSCISNPEDLDDRNSLAKLARSETVSTGVTVQELMKYLSKIAEGGVLSPKRFVQTMFVAAAGTRRTFSRDTKPFRFKP